MKMNLPNKLTIFRIILVVILVIVSLINIPGEVGSMDTQSFIMLLIFIIASITDKLDGDLARKNNQITDFGKFLDPIADKILVISTLIIFVEQGKLPAWVPIIIVFREFLVSGYRLVAATKNGKVIPANMWGKVKTVSQMVSIILLFIDKYGFGICFYKIMPNLKNSCVGMICEMTNGELAFNIVTTISVVFCVIATIVSGCIYFKGAKELFTEEKIEK